MKSRVLFRQAQSSYVNILIEKNIIKAVFFLFAAVCFAAPLSIVLFDIVHYIITHPECLLYFITQSFFKKICNSFLLSAAAAGSSLILGAVFSYLFFCLKISWHRLGMLFILLVIFSISPVISLVALTRFEIFNLLPIFWQAVIVLTFNMAPLPSIIFILTIGAMNRPSLETAFLCAKPGSVYRHIFMPQLFFPCTVCGLILFMLVFTHQEVPSFLGYRTYAEEFLSRIVVMTNLQEASATALPFLLLGCLVLGLLTWLAAKTHLYFLLDQTCKPMSFTLPINRKIFLAGRIAAALALAGILIKLYLHIDTASIVSLCSENIKAVQNSLLLSVVSGGAATLCAYQIYGFFRTQGAGYRVFLGTAVLLSYWLVPSSLIALGLIRFSLLVDVHSECYDVILLFLGYQTKLVPAGILIIAAMQLINREPADTVLQVLKISKYNIFTKLTIPLHWPKWLVTATLLTVFALNDLSVTVLLVPPGVETIIVKIYNLMHYGDYSLVAFLSLTQTVLVSIIVLFTAGAIKIYDTA